MILVKENHQIFSKEQWIDWFRNLSHRELILQNKLHELLYELLLPTTILSMFLFHFCYVCFMVSFVMLFWKLTSWRVDDECFGGIIISTCSFKSLNITSMSYFFIVFNTEINFLKNPKIKKFKTNQVQSLRNNQSLSSIDTKASISL